MSDRFSGPGDIRSGHPTTRNLVAAPDVEPEPTLPLSATFPSQADLTGDTISYGPDIPPEAQLRLLGNVEGRRLLVLGVGAGAEVVTLARQGARVIGVDPSLNRIEAARGAADAAEVKVELHQADLAELPFVRADSLDGALSVFALAGVDDLDRLFRQVHRVLHPTCHLVFSVPHPAYAMVDPDVDLPATVTRSYFDRSSRPWSTGRPCRPRVPAHRERPLHQPGSRQLPGRHAARTRARSQWTTQRPVAPGHAVGSRHPHHAGPQRGHLNGGREGEAARPEPLVR